MLGGGLHLGGVGEMLFHIRRRTKQAFLLAAPQCHADRAVHFEVGRFQDAHHLHRQRGAGSVIGGAGTVMPRIEVAAHHYQFVGLGAAGDFGDYVKRIRVVGDEAVLDVERQLHRHFVLQQAGDAVVVFCGQDDLRRIVGVLAIGAPAEKRSAVADAGDLHHDRRLLVSPEYLLALAESAHLRKSHAGLAGLRGRAAASSTASASAGGDHVERHLVELVGGVAARQRSSGEGQFAWRGDQHDLSFQLAMELVQIGRRRNGR